LNQAGLDGVALEVSGKTDTISTTRQAMRPVCTENHIRIDDVMESPKLGE
jgi:hypothetical protein